MDDETIQSLGHWWGGRPWRRKPSWMPAGMSAKDRSVWEAKRDREYYATHRSARFARWGVVVGLVISVVGFFVSTAYSRAVSDLGNGLMVLGVTIAFTSMLFTATARS